VILGRRRSGVSVLRGAEVDMTMVVINIILEIIFYMEFTSTLESRGIPLGYNFLGTEGGGARFLDV